MSGKKYLALMVFNSFLAGGPLFAFHVDFSKSEYEASGVPTGWTQVQATTRFNAHVSESQPQTPSGADEDGLEVNFYNATIENCLRRNNPIEDSLISDTILAKLKVYVEGSTSEDIDSFQVVVSTNAWQSDYIPVGAPILIKEKGRKKGDWITYTRTVTLNGLAGQHDLRVGILLLPGGQTGEYGYLQSLSVDVVATAAPKNVRLMRDGEVISEKKPLLPGDEEVTMSVCVAPDPKDEIDLRGVYGVINRNGIVLTNALFRVGETDEYTNSILNAMLDAGEELRISAFTKYASSLPTAGIYNPDDACFYEGFDGSDLYVVGRAGSVWINELSADRVEIAGTTNRVMLSGWSLALIDPDGNTLCSADLGEAFDFGKNMINGVVGLEVRDILWVGTMPTDLSSYSVLLRNPHGIPEHTVQMVFSESTVMGQVGYALWHESAGYGYDWTGTATDRTFTWVKLAESSFGTVNAGQGFNVPIAATLSVNTGISYAKVIASMQDVDNATTLGKTTDFPATSVDGVATFLITGFSPFPDRIRGVISGTAFGWTCRAKDIIIEYGKLETILPFVPTVASDDFHELASYWSNLDNKLKWEISWEERYGALDPVLFLNTYRAAPGTGRLRCKNYLSAHGRKMSAVSFDYRNTVDNNESHDEFSVLISTNANFEGDIKCSPALSNKRPAREHKDGEWYRYECILELPEDFSNASELWLELQSVSQGQTETRTYIDNLRIAFQDVALPTKLTRSVVTPVSGGSTGFVLDVLPQTTDEIQEVSADLHITVNGVKKRVPFAFADGALTNAIPLVKGEDDEVKAVQLSITPEALEKVLGTRFYAGDSVSYYAAVHYNSANGDTNLVGNTELEGLHQARYIPDNSKIDSEGRWIVEGAYKAIENQYGFTVDGPDIDILGTPVITADGIAFDYHAWDRTGNKGIIGLTATVRKQGEEVSTTALFEGDATNRVTDTCALTGLDANTEYTLTISGKRNSGGDLTSKSITFVTRPVLTATAIVGTSPNTAKLTASGQAAGFVVTPSDWVQESDGVQGDVRMTTWTRGEGTPNSQMSATVYATNKVGLASMTTNSPSGFTRAAVATKAPVIQKGTVTVEVGAEEGYVAGTDGNPEGTEYAVRVTTSDGGDALVTTNGVEVWKTLADWRAESVTVEKPTIDLLATNSFSFITRNFDKTVSPNESPVTTNCWFDMTAEVAGAEQTAEFGKVDVALKFSDPAQSDDARAEVEYKIVGRGDWASVESFDVPFDEIETTTNITWDAWTAVGETEGAYEYFLRARVTDEAHGRSSGWVEMKESGKLDFVKPTVELTSDTPDPFPLAKSPMKVEVKFSKPVTGFTKDSLLVVNGTAKVTGEGDTYTVSVTPKNDGVVTVQVLADKVADQFGNKNKASDPLSRTFDTKPPVIHSIEGEPGEMAVTNGTGFAFTAVATDESMPLKYHWATNGFDVAGNATSELTGEDALEGTNVVTVFAEDNAGNLSMKAKRTWVVDTIAPTKPEIAGKPDKFTNVPAFSMTASSEDATRLTYHWTFNDADFTGATLAKTAREGANAVRVYATDEAGNVSPTNSYSWTLDTLKPTDLKIDGDPQEGVVTNGTEFAFTASASDVTQLTFHWTTNGVPVADYTAAGLSGTAIEGTNTVSVYAKDAAGNACDPTNRTWVVDTIAPTKPEISGKPAALTNEVSFSMTASSVDATRLIYHWTFNDEDFTGATLAKTAREGANAARVYATDEAGNVSPTNFWNWVVDTQAPTDPAITGTPKDGAITNSKSYSFTAESYDDHLDAFYWSLDGAAGVRALPGVPFAGGELADGLHTVGVYAKDVAGNKSAATNWTWTVDTTAPTVPVISGTPANGSVTNEPNFSLVAAATDNLTTITYHWLTNGVAAADATNLVGRVEEEGLFEVKCYATDAAGNVSETNDWSWTFDRTAPTVPVITGTPKDGAITNSKGYSFTAVSYDDHLDAFYWSLDGAAGVRALPGVPFAGGELTDGPHTVDVYAKDVAGNKSAATNWTWTVDTKRPTVTLTSTASGHFNRKAAPMEVTATFSEEVTNFTYECVTVQTGTVSNEVETVEEKKVFKFWVYPEHYGVPTFIDEETVSVSIDENKVWDYAGNGNEASLNEQGEQAPLTRVYDTKSPIVTLSSETPDNFNASLVPLKVTIGVTGKGVTELAQESIVITNGVVAKFEKTDEKQGDDGVITEKIYALEVTPTKEALITVVVPESVLTNMTGNTNPASEPPVLKTYDNTAPKNLAISGEPAQNKVTAATTFDFEATADDLTAMKFHWTRNGVAVTDNETSKYSGTVEKGTNWVTVSATDAAGNTCAEVKRTWVVDFEPPENLTLSGTPGKMDEIVVTTGTDFAYTASATDDTQIKYHWATNGVEVVDNLSADLVGTAVEGTNTVSVYATDEANNVSVTNTILWVVDTIPPTKPEIGGADKPAKVTRSRSFSLTASSEDATKITYHWALMKRGEDTASTGDEPTFVRSGLADGEYTVSVYATDQADNVSLTNSYSWTIDNVAPDNLKIEGTPAETPFVTTVTEVDLTASATDNVTPADQIAYTWDFNEEKGIEKGANLNRTAIEGTNTATVCATDEAGNESRKSRTWVVDTHCPTNLHFVSAFPGEGVVTNGAAFAFVVAAEDATQITYHWFTNGVAVANECSAQFGGMAVEGTNAVSVYAEDEAHNVSVTNTIRWILDTIAPTKPEFVEKPESITKDKHYNFTATAGDMTKVEFFWRTASEGETPSPQQGMPTRGGAVSAAQTGGYSGDLDVDGKYTVYVYAVDAAGNVSPTNTFSWTLDTIAPDNLVITGTPADGSATNEPNYSLSATAEDATTLTFHWTLGDKTEAVTNFIGEVEEEGAYEVTCYATDAAGNSSVTNSWRWTFDMTPPTLPVISGTPANGSVTNKPNYDLTATATDNLTVITYHWMTNGVAAADVTNFVGEVNAEGVYVVSCYATDAADNVSETNVWSWTFDKTPPAALAISGKPEEGEVVATNGFAFTASATDLTRVSYRWTLNGSGGATGENFIGNAPEGTNTVKVTATDEAGNVSAVSRTWVVDTFAPTNLVVTGTPGDGVLTNEMSFSWTVSAKDATQITYHWLTNGVEVVDETATNNFVGTAFEGTNVVGVFATDEADNISVTNTVRWTVDTFAPTVTLSSETSEDHVINMTDVLKVTATFSEPVVGFTDKSVTVSNGTVTNVVAVNERVYEVWIAPRARDVGKITASILAGVVKDKAGNDNVAWTNEHGELEELRWSYDTLPPTVKSLVKVDKLDPFTWGDCEDGAFKVSVTFSEAVTNFTKEAVSVSNGMVRAVSPAEGAAESYTVEIVPPSCDCLISIWIAENVVTDLAGNGNEVSEQPLTLTYDVTNPTEPDILGTPKPGDIVTQPGTFNLIATNSTDWTAIRYRWRWRIKDVSAWSKYQTTEDGRMTGPIAQEGVYEVEVYAKDEVGFESIRASITWEYRSGEMPSGVDFGGGVTLPVSPDYVTNDVTFTAVDFHPGEDSAISMTGFIVDPPATEISTLTNMWLIVSDTLNGSHKKVQVREVASYDDETLTVTIPSEGTMNNDVDPAVPYESFFIFGVDNKE